ncbi:MAG: hypothetical protein LBG79_00985 [Spirochaetaceae bacterium]|nr:hypothetical protein [Spirochaetaceae bacterium]
MKCKDVLDILYESDEISIFVRLEAALHTAFCASCAAEKRRLNMAHRLMRGTFMPFFPNMAASVMRVLRIDETGAFKRGSFSLRGWVIAGVFILFSLASAYFGIDFRAIVESSGVSFILPFGITTGCVITIYGALFILSHLDDFHEKFVR